MAEDGDCQIQEQRWSMINFESGDVMARLEQIIDQARTLSYAEKQKLRDALDAELDQQSKNTHASRGR